jgi:hypothetical protein
MYLELHDAALWFHTDVHKWSQEVKKKYLEDLDLLQYLTNVPLLALVEEENTKLLNQTLMTILAIIGFLLVCVIIGWIIWSCAHKKEDYFQFEEDKHAP